MTHISGPRSPTGRAGVALREAALGSAASSLAAFGPISREEGDCG